MKNFKACFLTVFSTLSLIFLFSTHTQQVSANSIVAKTIYEKSSWNNKSAISAKDNNPAFTTLFTLPTKKVTYSQNESEVLIAKNLKLNIPSGATIQGITVTMVKRVDRFLDGKREFPITDKSVKLILNGNIIGNDKSSTIPYSNDRYQTFTYGSESDNWGTTLTSADINSPDFGVAYSVKRSIEGIIPQTLFIDQIKLEVKYTLVTEQNCLITQNTRFNSACSSTVNVPLNTVVTSATVTVQTQNTLTLNEVDLINPLNSLVLANELNLAPFPFIGSKTVNLNQLNFQPVPCIPGNQNGVPVCVPQPQPTPVPLNFNTTDSEGKLTVLIGSLEVPISVTLKLDLNTL
jgi:hypothetical protein